MARLTLRFTPISIVVDAFNVVPFFKVEQLEGIEVECKPRGCRGATFYPILTVVDVFKVEQLKGTRVVCVPRGW